MKLTSTDSDHCQLNVRDPNEWDLASAQSSRLLEAYGSRTSFAIPAPRIPAYNGKLSWMHSGTSGICHQVSGQLNQDRAAVVAIGQHHVRTTLSEKKGVGCNNDWQVLALLTEQALRAKPL